MTLSNKIDGDILYAADINEMDNNIDWLLLNQAEQNIDIIIIQQNDAISPPDHSGNEADVFSDEDGYRNTVDIPNTDAYYVTANKEYACEGLNELYRINQPSFEGDLTPTVWIPTNNLGANCNAINGRRNDWSTQGSWCYTLWLTSNFGTWGASSIKVEQSLPSLVDFDDVIFLTFDYRKFTDSQVIQCNPLPKFEVKIDGITYYSEIIPVTLIAETGKVRIDVSSVTGIKPLSFVLSAGGGPQPPVTATQYDVRIDIDNLKTTNYGNSVIQTNTLVTSNPTNITDVFVTAHTTTPSDSSITFDVSSDNGVTWTTDQPLNTKVNITSTQGKDLKIKFNLKPSTDHQSTPTISAYSVAYWD